MSQEPQSSSAILSYFQVPETFNFVSLHTAAGYIELLKFIHNDMVTIPNKKRKIISEITVADEGDYYVVTLNWQTAPQSFATASAFVYDSDGRDGCEIWGYAELTPAIPLFGILLFVVAVVVFLATNSPIVFLIWLVAFVLSTRGALHWRDTLIQHLYHLAQMIPQQREDFSEDEFDERVDLLVKGIKQGA